MVKAKRLTLQSTSHTLVDMDLKELGTKLSLCYMRG